MLSERTLDRAAAATLAGWMAWTWRGGWRLARELRTALRARRFASAATLVAAPGANLYVLTRARRREDRPAGARPSLRAAARTGGLALSWLGLTWALCARRSLGDAWTPFVDLRGDEVRATGPYAVVRHPLYGGAAVFYAGVALASWRRPALAVGAVHVVGFLAKALVEDRALMARSERYRAYAARTPRRLVPRAR